MSFFSLIIEFGIPLVMGGGTLYQYYQMKADEELLSEETIEPFSDTVQLILELLQEDDGWEKKTVGSLGHVVYQHDSLGISIRVHRKEAFFVRVMAENGEIESIDTSLKEDEALARATKAFDDRAENRRRDGIANTLATRILERGRGEVRSLLGGAGVSRIPPSGDDDTSVVSTQPAGILEYDGSTNKIRTLGREDSLQLSATLRRRYDLSPRSELKIFNSDGTLKEYFYDY